jgi:caffeoyl-CoA O-methyltransferase
MLPHIRKIIKILEKQSRKERTKKYNIDPEDRMLAITYETGKFMHSMLVATKAKSVLELGTSTGFSTLWIIDALLVNHKNPHILTIEKNPKKIIRAKLNFKQAKVSKFIKIKHGTISDVLEKIPKNQKFDFIFMDADKENLKKYADLTLARLRPGGIMMTDNMLYPTKYRQIMKEYARYLRTKPGIQTYTLSIGFGEEITVKRTK